MFLPQKRSDARWRKASLLRQHIPLQQRHWVFDRDSLTDKLVACASGDFSVAVLCQQIRRPLLSEARELGLVNTRRAVVREVVLLGGSDAWVYARTVIPLTSLKGSLKRLRYLGNRSLGSALFADPHLQRDQLQAAHILPEYLPSDSLLANAKPKWGRRSVFTLKGKPLLVTEVFLERLWNNTSIN